MRLLSAKLRRYPCLVIFAVALATAALVVAPLTGQGYVLLLDWVPGPHSPIVPESAYGLHGGLVLSLPFGLLVGLLGHLLGPLVNWLVLAAVFPVAMVSVSRLIGRSLPERLGAALLYGVNPFVLQRMVAGQPALLFAYALLPVVVASFLRASEASGILRLAPALWLVVLIGFAPQFAWIAGVPLVAVVAWRRLRPAMLAWAAGVLVVAAACSAYLLVPTLGHGSGVRLPVVMLSDFATRPAAPGANLYVSLAGLYGFWRPGTFAAPELFSGWPFLLLAILLVAAAGAWAALHDPKRRPLAVVLLSSGVAGYFLALGEKGPTGSLYRWAYLHVPFFALMREAEIFASLVALAYAVFFGWGVGQLVAAAKHHRGRLGTVVASAMLVLAYTPTMFWGFGDQVTPSRLPASWQAADKAMGAGPGKVLFLPWHEYLPFPFTGGRGIANPAPSFFSRQVIAGDNVELPGVATQSTSPRGAFLGFLMADGTRTHHLGALLAPLGVRFVVLSKVVDWQAYGWLSDQVDMHEILDTSTLEVWRNDEAAPLGRRVARLVTVANWSTLVALSGEPGFATSAYEVAHAGPGPVTLGQATSSTSRSGQAISYQGISAGAALTSGGVRRCSATSYEISSGATPIVELAATYQRGWQVGKARAVELAEGNMAFRVGPGPAGAEYLPWRWIEWTDLLCALLVVMLGAALGRAAWRRTKRVP